jgi:hypothetical protein
MVHRTRIAALMCLLMFACAGEARAQDAHYWYNTYGTKSTLLRGAVIGTVTDLSAAFYNPGALALSTEPAFILGAKAWDYGTITVVNGGGVGADLRTSISGPAPDLLAGVLPFHIREGDRLTYSVLTRKSTDMLIQSDGAAIGAPIPDFNPPTPGNEVFAGQVSLTERLSEVWTGVSWSVPVGKKVGVGFTQFVAVRNERGTVETYGNALATDGTIAASTIVKQYDYQVWNLVTKFGAAANLNPVTLGVSVTTPALGLFGGGNVGVDTVITGYDLNGDGVNDPVFTSNRQRDVNARYHSPWSVGAGAGYKFTNTQFSASAEWFQAVDIYQVLDTTPFTAQSSGIQVSSPITDGAKSVLDYGVGISQQFRPKLVGFVGFCSDRSPHIPGTSLTIGAWDLYHFSAGAQFSVRSSQLIFGVTYSYGSKNLLQVEGKDAAPPGPYGPAVPTDASAQFRSVRVVFGFTVGTPGA